MHEAREVPGEDRQYDQTDHEQPGAGGEIGEQWRRNEADDNPVNVVEPVQRDQRRTDPGNYRQRLADKAASKGEYRRKPNHPKDGKVETVHDATPTRRCRGSGPNGDRSGAKRSTSSFRWPIGAVSSPAATPASRRFPRRIGVHASAKPSLAASLSRASVWPTGRTSPERAISPNTTVSVGTGVSVRAETSAAATARSAAGSTMRNPPATLR